MVEFRNIPVSKTGDLGASPSTRATFDTEYKAVA